MNPFRSNDLFETPSRLQGWARTLDLWATFDPWPWPGSSALDARALYRDWEIIGGRSRRRFVATSLGDASKRPLAADRRRGMGTPDGHEAAPA
jgi:hypothetical protein